MENMKEPASTDNERLIKVLQAGFSDLARNQREQAKKQEEQAERLLQAVEANKPKAPITDKQTEFWNVYKTLADEHDKELKERYGTDLNITLVFFVFVSFMHIEAGLFSAVDSAFIIQIQPEIQPHGTGAIIVVAQSLLYISLGSTLLAAFLAVLGMQWLMHYSAAGERGSIETRGLKRQQKLDGLQRWKFDICMHIFPLLLQLGLLLFSVGLSVYLWRSHLAHAIIAVFFTSFGLIAHTTLLISAVAAPDSPFQTPLAPLVVWLIPTTLWNKAKIFFSMIMAHSWQLISHLLKNYKYWLRNHLPVFLQHQIPRNRESEVRRLFNINLQHSSPEVSAVSWVLQTSTDPLVLDVTAEMAINLQWPNTMDVMPQLQRLHDALLACFDYFEDDGEYIVRGVLNGMALHARHLGRAYCALRWILRDKGPSCSPKFIWFGDWTGANSTLEPELKNVVQILEGKPAVICDSNLPLATKWALQVIPSFHYPDFESRQTALKYFLKQFDDIIPTLDTRSFTDFLCCISNLLHTMSNCDLAWVDKSLFQARLFEEIFTTLLAYLKINNISMDTTAQIISIAGRLATPFPNQRAGGDTTWIYKALDSINNCTEDNVWDNRTITGITGLFNALLHHGSAPAKEHINIILRGLSTSGPIYTSATHLLLQKNIINWYQDDKLQSILQKASVWSLMMSDVHNVICLAENCIQLGHNLCEIPSWQPFIHGELCSWITIFFSGERWDLLEKYTSVIATIWTPDSGGLVKNLARLQFHCLAYLNQIVQMLRCTSLVILRTEYEDPEHFGRVKITPQFMTAFLPPLHSSIIRVHTIFKKLYISSTCLKGVSLRTKKAFKDIAEIMGDMAGKMPKTVVDLENEEQDWDYWQDLRWSFEAEIRRIRITGRGAEEPEAQLRAGKQFPL
ncbi:hypothetical protein B0H13DRAFT_1920611 [Mycena leptocephala]|nr:hypothetical protein B0H13DRAFT_1920611 [Mycena leptocephala]